MGLQPEDVSRLRQEWKKKGEICTHPHIEKEYFRSMHTGEYVCTTCGEDFRTQDKWMEERAKASAKRRKDG